MNQFKQQGHGLPFDRNYEGVPLHHGVHLQPAASIFPVAIEWLWDGYLAKGKFHVLGGPPGTGKTTIALQIAATISTGGFGQSSWPDKSAAPLGTVIIWSGEDGIEDTVIPRLIAAGADMTRIHIIRGTRENGRTRTFDFSTDIPKLSDALARIGPVDLIIIDSVVQAVAGDSNRNSDVRRALVPLVELGEHHHCAILGLTHVNKSSKGKEPLDRINGSLAFGAVARVVMLAAKRQDNASGDIPSCVLVRVKSNIGPDDGGFEYQIQSLRFQMSAGIFSTPVLRWNEEPLQGSAKDILKSAETGESSDNPSAVDEAGNFLNHVLARGGIPFPEISALAQDRNISASAIKRAKSMLGIISKKQCGAGPASPSVWYLPEPPARQPFSTNFEDRSAPPRSNLFTRFGASEQHLPQRRAPFDHTSQTEGREVPDSNEKNEPVEPVEPVERPEPEITHSARQLNEQLIQMCVEACRRHYSTQPHKFAPLTESDAEELVDSIIERAIKEVLYCDPDEAKYRTALRSIGWWTSVD